MKTYAKQSFAFADENLRKTIFAAVPGEKMVDSLKTVNDLDRSSDDDFHDELLVKQYGRVRRFLPHPMNHVEFNAALRSKAVLGVFDYLQNIGIFR